MQLDASGNPVVATSANSFIMGRAGEDYHAAMVQGIKAALQTKVTNDVTDLRAQNPTDQAAFSQGIASLANAYRTNPNFDPRVGDALATQVSNEGAAHRANMVEASMTRDTKESLQAISTTIDDSTSKLRILARKGAINTPEYDHLQDTLEDSYDALGGNKLFGYSPEQIASERARASSLLNGEFIVGRIDDTFTRKGKNAALEAIKTGIDENAALDLPIAERNQLHNYAVSRLSYLTDQQQTAVAALKPLVDLQVKAYQSGNNGSARVSDREADQTFAQLQSLGAFKEAAELQNARIISDRMAALRNIPPDQKAAVLLQSNSGSAPGGYIGALHSQEGGTSASTNPVSGAAGPNQFLPSTWAGLLKSHPELNLTPGGIRDPAENARAIVAFTNDNKAALTAAGIQPTDGNTYMAHFLGAQGATSFIKAMQANPGAPAAQFNLAAATANPTIFYKGGDPSQPRSLQEVYALQTRRFGGGTTPITSAAAGGVQQPFTDAEAAANPGLRLAWRQQLAVDEATQVKFAKAQFETLDTGIKFAGAPSPDMLGPAATVLQIADRYPEQLGAQADKLRGALAGQPAGLAAAGTPDGGTTMLEQAQELVRRSPGDRLALALGEGVKAGVEQGKKLLAEDQFEYAHRAEWIPQKPLPIDLSTPDGAAALPQAMQMRAVAATAIASHTHVAGTSALALGDLPPVKSVMTSGTLDQRMAVLGAITNAGMSEPVLRATLQQLAGSKETLPLAVAGSLVKDAPEAARGILQGQLAMQTEPKLAPNKDDFPGELAKILPFNDLAAGPAREGVDGAVQAYYAKLSADAGDTTGVINADRVTKAVDAVTGGVFGFRGGKAVAPWYGATQSQTDAAIRSLGDGDFARARTADGSSFPASALKPSLSAAFTWSNWRLQSYGDGKYLVYSGADTARQYLGDANGGRFVLDLGSKRAAVTREAPALVDSIGTPLVSGAYYGGGG